jgi:hypothetical protein
MDSTHTPPLVNLSNAKAGISNTAAWHARADELARWAWGLLVNRTDVWGGYYCAPDGEGGWHTQQTTHPRKADRGRVLLTPDILLRHFRATYSNHIIGLHTTSPDNTSRWCAVDIDCHGPEGSDPAANLSATLAWFDRLRRLGFAPLLTDSNGTGGYHLLALFAEAVLTPRVFAFDRWLTDDHAAHGLPVRPETFPKQARIPEGGYGNWLRLPGRHHTREHWSRVWDGSAWLEGERAVEHILALCPSPASLIPAEVREPAPPVVVRYASPFAAPPAGDRLTARIDPYMARLPRLGEGQGRDDVAFHFACFLVRDLRLSDDDALAWLARWDADNRPPKGEAAMRKAVANAHKYGRAAYGSGLGRPAPARPSRGRRGHGYISFTAGGRR